MVPAEVDAGTSNAPALFMLYQELATWPALPSREPTADMPGLMAPAAARELRAGATACFNMVLVEGVDAPPA